MTAVTRKRRSRLLPALLLQAICFMSCEWEVPTAVVVRDGPTFEFTGSGRLARLTVYAPKKGRRIAAASAEIDTVIWQIVTSKGYFKGAGVEGLRVTYGQIPDGYEQTVPKPSETAEPPPVGVVCSFFAETTNAPGIGGAIFMSPTGPVEIDVPDQCLRRIDGRDVEMNCRTNEPYQDPADLEKFVQEHRVRR